MVRLKGETSADFSASSSATDFCLTGAAGGAVLGRGDGKMFWPSCHKHKHTLWWVNGSILLSLCLFSPLNNMTKPKSSQHNRNLKDLMFSMGSNVRFVQLETFLALVCL